jgi:serine/threonine protein kinase
MAYYEGETLDKRITDKPLPLEEVIDIAIQIAEGLTRAHKKDIIHRDIKPANILITEEGQVKIVDFGLAKVSGQTLLTKQGTTLGTVAYMSPEQAHGEEVDHRTDIWSFGIMLYEMLTGQRPFRGDYEQAVMFGIMNDDPVPSKKLRKDIPEELDRLTQHILQKERDQRIQGAEELVKRLKTLSRKSTDEASKRFDFTELVSLLKKPKIAIMVLAVLILLIIAIFLPYYRVMKISIWCRILLIISPLPPSRRKSMYI